MGFLWTGGEGGGPSVGRTRIAVEGRPCLGECSCWEDGLVVRDFEDLQTRAGFFEGLSSTVFTSSSVSS